MFEPKQLSKWRGCRTNDYIAGSCILHQWRLNAIHEWYFAEGEPAYVNTIYQCQTVFGKDHWELVQLITIILVNMQTAGVLEEGKIFPYFQETEPWSEEQDTVRHNMARSIIMEDERFTNEGNDMRVLQSPLDAFGRNFPIKATGLPEKTKTKPRGASTNHNAPVNNNVRNAAQEI